MQTVAKTKTKQKITKRKQLVEKKKSDRPNVRTKKKQTLNFCFVFILLQVAGVQVQVAPFIQSQESTRNAIRRIENGVLQIAFWVWTRFARDSEEAGAFKKNESPLYWPIEKNLAEKSRQRPDDLCCGRKTITTKERENNKKKSWWAAGSNEKTVACIIDEPKCCYRINQNSNKFTNNNVESKRLICLVNQKSN